MKIQHLLTAAVVIALTSSTAFAGKPNGPKPTGGAELHNEANNSLAIGTDAEGSMYGVGSGQSWSGDRAISGSIYLENGACDCDFKKLHNDVNNSVAVGKATAGSIHINTGMGKKGG